MNKRRGIALIAPQQMISAFSVLIDSAANLGLLASASSLDELLMILGKKTPDVVLVYLVRESGLDMEKSAYDTITWIKVSWPDAFCITIVKYPSQLEMVLEIGADLALLDGVNAQRLLDAIEGKLQ